MCEMYVLTFLQESKAKIMNNFKMWFHECLFVDQPSLSSPVLATQEPPPITALS